MAFGAVQAVELACDVLAVVVGRRFDCGGCYGGSVVGSIVVLWYYKLWNRTPPTH